MILIEAKDEYIFVQYDETYSKKILLDLIKKVQAKSKELNCFKLLGDISKMDGKVSTVDRFEFGVLGASMFRESYRIALVYRAEEINQFAETVSINRGLNARIFSEMNAATHWLLNGDTRK